MLDWEEFLSQCKPTRGNKDLLQLTGDKQKVDVDYDSTHPHNSLRVLFS